MREKRVQNEKRRGDPQMLRLSGTSEEVAASESPSGEKSV
ncbi:hypothetical protein DES52_11798 [Deinococcus yavapaiensis KR-236]|uniref:Uncharacterized protein n=1 Tax=Deinococcus yavapaiensis KR-236 TaxID=694435 RepID=A0A318S6W7_9DEIO|nr:hypothetical protein DES52_11798 [Deinococcus yavapaiensis KR-236]